MKIRLAILDSDSIYAARIAKVFEAKYADVLELYTFTELELAKEHLKSSKIDVFLVSESFDIDPREIPPRCGFAYLVESPDVMSVRDQHVICKFQRVEMFYKQILNLYSEGTNQVVNQEQGEGTTKVIVFSSPCGGVGTSCMAAACAMRYAAAGARVLYLNLETFGSPETYFQGEGTTDMSDVIYALKSKKSNLTMKLESCVKKSEEGVEFYAQAKLALDMMELTEEDVITLVHHLKTMGIYETIVLDMDFALDKERLSVYRQANAWVWVSDGSETANGKVLRAYHALSVAEQKDTSGLMVRLRLIYNQFSSKTGQIMSIQGIKELGGAPIYVHAVTRQVVEQLANIAMLDRII